MASGKIRVSGGKRSGAATPQAEPAKPWRQLVEAAVLLLALLGLSCLGLGFLKQRVDRRLDTTVFDDAVAKARASLNSGSVDRAEETLMAVGQIRRQLQEPLVWTFLDYLAVMPEYRAYTMARLESALRSPTGDTRVPPLLAELALRSEEPGQAFTLLDAAVAGPGAPATAAYRRAAAIRCQEFAALAPHAGEHGFAWRELPRTSLLWTLPPAALAPHPAAGAAQGALPLDGYARGLVAFHEGRLLEAEEALNGSWASGTHAADTAYLLGAISEAKANREEARAWYRHAVAGSASHLAAATALLRLSRASS